MSMTPPQMPMMQPTPALSASSRVAGAMGQQVEPNQAGYRSADDPNVSCAACLHFQPPNACELVAGDINPSGVCDLFEAATPVEEAMEAPQ